MIFNEKLIKKRCQHGPKSGGLVPHVYPLISRGDHTIHVVVTTRNTPAQAAQTQHGRHSIGVSP